MPYVECLYPSTFRPHVCEANLLPLVYQVCIHGLQLANSLGQCSIFLLGLFSFICLLNDYTNLLSKLCNADGCIPFHCYLELRHYTPRCPSGFNAALMNELY